MSGARLMKENANAKLEEERKCESFFRCVYEQWGRMLGPGADLNRVPRILRSPQFTSKTNNVTRINTSTSENLSQDFALFILR